MRVLILSRTKMRGNKCVGGLLLHNNQSIRLLTASGTNQPNNTAYQVGQIWDLAFTPAQSLTPPHTEDVLVAGGTYLSSVPNLAAFLAARVTSMADRYWEGGPERLFGGVVRATGNGSGFIAQPHVPPISTGFWRPDQDLTARTEGNRVRYVYPGNYGGARYFTYVGDAAPLPVIPARGLVRISLARWWRPQDAPDLERRCYLQISGWYL
jgi:hypothetical protein